MKIYFASGTNREDLISLKNCGAERVLQSFFYLKNKPPFDVKELLIDSGGFSARMRGVIIKVEEYANYINEYGIKLAFNLDTNDKEETKRNQKYLNNNTNAYIIPIYHLSDYREEKNLLDTYINEFPYIAIGGVANVQASSGLKDNLYNYVFSKTKNKVKVHGLGIASTKLLFRYPWYSVDTSSWKNSSRYGVNPFEKDKKIDIVHKRKFSTRSRDMLLIKGYLNLEKESTKLWEKRGVKWE